VGDGRWCVQIAVDNSSTRVGFGRSIGKNQGIQFPIARAHVELEAADMMCRRAAALFEAGADAGFAANAAKLLASEAAFKAADVALQTHGGFGFAVDYDIERKWRETRLYQIAPISTNMVLAYVAQHVLGLERSY
jgi:acyl-CoA dehydrogenase